MHDFLAITENRKREIRTIELQSREKLPDKAVGTRGELSYLEQKEAYSRELDHYCSTGLLFKLD